MDRERQDQRHHELTPTPPPQYSSLALANQHVCHEHEDLGTWSTTIDRPTGMGRGSNRGRTSQPAPPALVVANHNTRTPLLPHRDDAAELEEQTDGHHQHTRARACAREFDVKLFLHFWFGIGRSPTYGNMCLLFYLVLLCATTAGISVSIFTATSHCQGLRFKDPLWILNMCGCSTGIMLFLLWACGHWCKNRRITKLAFCAWVFSLLFTAILTALGVLIYINQKYIFFDDDPDVTPEPSPSCNYLRWLPMATAGSMTTLCALFCLVSLCCCVVL